MSNNSNKKSLVVYLFWIILGVVIGGFTGSALGDFPAGLLIGFIGGVVISRIIRQKINI